MRVCVDLSEICFDDLTKKQMHKPGHGYCTQVNIDRKQAKSIHVAKDKHKWLFLIIPKQKDCIFDNKEQDS